MLYYVSKEPKKGENLTAAEFNNKQLIELKKCAAGSASNLPNIKVKILETLLLPAFKKHCLLANQQYGSKESRSTTTALTAITPSIANNLNKKTIVYIYYFMYIDIY